MKPTTFYLTASSANKGALSIFLAYGGEEDLARALDARVGGRAACTPSNPLSINELRYGWLRTGGEGGEVLDEVMLACPAPGRRVLMTHGGGLIRNQAAAYFAANSFHEITFEPDRIAPLADPLLDVLLASCRTEGQAAAVLAARAGGGDRAGLARLLAPRRVVLAGAPNAGKSSLLNALAGYDRAFVDPEAGATRDGVDELVALSGWSVWLGDTPGYGGAGEGLEGEAWRRAGARLRLAEEIWFVADGSEAWGSAAESAASAVAALIGGEGEREGGLPVLVIVNKADCPLRLSGEPWRKHFPAARSLFLSSLPGGNAFDAVEEYVAEAWRV